MSSPSTSTMSTDPYKILSVSRSATQEQIRRAYKKACLRYHPDKHPPGAARVEAERVFKLIVYAYTQLTDNHNSNTSTTFTATTMRANRMRTTSAPTSAPRPRPPPPASSPSSSTPQQQRTTKANENNENKHNMNEINSKSTGNTKNDENTTSNNTTTHHQQQSSKQTNTTSSSTTPSNNINNNDKDYNSSNYNTNQSHRSYADQNNNKNSNFWYNTTHSNNTNTTTTSNDNDIDDDATTTTTFTTFGQFGYKLPDREVDLPLTLEELSRGCVKRRKLRVAGSSDALQPVLTICVKPGYRPGDRVRFRSAWTPPGAPMPVDVVFVISQKPHATFRLDGDDLRLTMRLNLVDALTGALLVVKTLEGTPLNLLLEPVISAKHEEHVTGHGMPRRSDPTQKGDLIVSFDITFPNCVDAEHRPAVRELFAKFEKQTATNKNNNSNSGGGGGTGLNDNNSNKSNNSNNKHSGSGNSTANGASTKKRHIRRSSSVFVSNGGTPTSTPTKSDNNTNSNVNGGGDGGSSSGIILGANGVEDMKKKKKHDSNLRRTSGAHDVVRTDHALAPKHDSTSGSGIGSKDEKGKERSDERDGGGDDDSSNSQQPQSKSRRRFASIFR